jgi:hypothetical protein
VPLTVSQSTNDLTQFMEGDLVRYDRQFYRATPLSDGQKLYVIEVSTNAMDWSPFQTHTSANLPPGLPGGQAGAPFYYRTRPIF